MLSDLFNFKPRKKERNTALMAGAISLAMVSGAAITWYASRKLKHRSDEMEEYEGNNGSRY